MSTACQQQDWSPSSQWLLQQNQYSSCRNGMHDDCLADLAVLRATKHKSLVETTQARPHHKAALVLLAAHVLLHRASPSSWGGAVGGRVAQLMQVDALLVEVEQQVALVLADEDGSDAALLLYGQTRQL